MEKGKQMKNYRAVFSLRIKKDKKIYSIFAFLFIFVMPKISAECSSASYKKFSNDLNKGAFAFYTNLDNKYKTVMRVSILSEHFFTLYDLMKAYLECANRYIVSNTDNRGYKTAVKELRDILTWFDDALVNLQLNVELISASAQQEHKNSQSLSLAIDALQDIKNDILKKTYNYSDKAKAIYEKSRTTLKSEFELKNLEKKTKETIFPEYKKFFNWFEAIKKKAQKEHKAIAPKDIIFLLSMENYIEPDSIETIARFSTMLERFKTQASIEQKKAWFGNSTKIMIDDAQDVVTILRTFYPTIHFYQTIVDTKNNSALILCLESGILYNLLTVLKNVCESLIASIRQ